ncbi:MAG: sigma-70 family RNA polymerase sigma factor [Phycisphaerae bacterium]|nr:sigma-70 family RNA polymerase sigma factor [Phycisphaerae bacterium]
MADVTRILKDLKDGDRAAADALLAAVYDELRRLATRKVARERPGQTLQATALVHEAYLRLVGDTDADWQNRGHFFAAAAEAMRRILVEQARRKSRIKHGGGRHRRDLKDDDLVVPPESVDLIALDEALEKLSHEDRVKAELVKLRYFTGLTVAEAGAALGISRATADRYWQFARAWLYNEINAGQPADAQDETPASDADDPI